MTLTSGDLKKVRVIVREEIDDVLDEKLDEKLTQFRSDMYDRLDEILREVVAMREEQEMNAHHLSDHEDRIEKLEKFQFAN